MAFVDTVAEFRIGTVINQTIKVLTRNAPIYLPVALLVMAPMLITDLMAGGAIGTMNVAHMAGPGLAVLSVLLQMVCPALLQAALVQATITDLNGGQARLGPTLATSFSLFLPVMGLSIVCGLGIGFGFLLLVVPGIMLATAWAVVVPVRVAERTSFSDSFNRSGALTAGNRWKILGLYLLYGAVFVILLGLVGIVAQIALGGTENTSFIVGTWIMTVIVSLIAAVGATVIYFQLRTIKEGASPDDLAAFD